MMPGLEILGVEPTGSLAGFLDELEMGLKVCAKAGMPARNGDNVDAGLTARHC